MQAPPGDASSKQLVCQSALSLDHSPPPIGRLQSTVIVTTSIYAYGNHPLSSQSVHFTAPISPSPQHQQRTQARWRPAATSTPTRRPSPETTSSPRHHHQPKSQTSAQPCQRKSLPPMNDSPKKIPCQGGLFLCAKSFGGGLPHIRSHRGGCIIRPGTIWSSRFSKSIMLASFRNTQQS